MKLAGHVQVTITSWCNFGIFVTGVAVPIPALRSLMVSGVPFPRTRRVATIR